MLEQGTGMHILEMTLFIFVELRNLVLEKANLFKKLSVHFTAMFLEKRNTSWNFERFN